MFEKSLYDLIRGLRNHKGSEREYIHHSLRECRNEIRGSDMDLKATALLKLIYLEMFGHDMSWASFHALEVMSSAKYPQKRVGYLAAVQSFRPDTEVLMLATNLLKKDISSPLTSTISLPVVALPHLITSSLALSLLSDLLPRLTHTNPNVRKKTVAALYRLALVYPDTLRSAWPKIKEMLISEEEESSVTAAVVNVVCELSWRRPRDFLSLAPRLFDLLVGGGNNWMAIKIIKLFATLTPLEPRLIKKLSAPLINLIQSTPAMSLLYECINGVIQGGILDGVDSAREAEEVASLCVGKLRGMISIEGDPNLKYVALLAFHRIVDSHPHLVSMHQDVIMDCIDDPDTSIRFQALDLITGMVNSDNLAAVVQRLIRQLSSVPASMRATGDDRSTALGIEPAADSEGEDPEETLDPSAKHYLNSSTLPAEYRINTIRRITEMCSKNTYEQIVDFEWYLNVLIKLIKLIPSDNAICNDSQAESKYSSDGHGTSAAISLACLIGQELRNIAVRVSAVRADAVLACQSLIQTYATDSQLGPANADVNMVLAFAAWVAGEYSQNHEIYSVSLEPFIQPKIQSLPPAVISAYLQAIPKVFAALLSRNPSWTPERQSMISLLVARMSYFIEPLTRHSNVEVQERSMQLFELMRLVSQAITNHDNENNGNGSGPLLLTNVLPQLYSGFDLNAVAPEAQRKVPLPNELDLETSINQSLTEFLQRAEQDFRVDDDGLKFGSFYLDFPIRHRPNYETVPTPDSGLPSYQQLEVPVPAKETSLRKRIQSREQNADDPFYIGNTETSSGASTPFHEILKNANGEDVNVDSIPIIDLELGDKSANPDRPDSRITRSRRERPEKFHVAQDETIENEVANGDTMEMAQMAAGEYTRPQWQDNNKSKKSLLQVDSSGLSEFPLIGDGHLFKSSNVHQDLVEDEEMAKALAEVERLRLEMQRASERIEASDGAPADGTLIKKRVKKKRIPKQHAEDGGRDPRATAVAKSNNKSRRKSKKPDETAPQVYK